MRDQDIMSSHLGRYPGCTFMAFSTFICSSLDDGSSYLRRDASIDCNLPFHTTMKAYAAVMIAIWPIGMPVLYSYGFWSYWPMISKLRRAELRAKSTKALGKTRRESTSNHRQLEGKLLATLRFLEEGETSALYISDGTRCKVSLTHGKLTLTASNEEFMLELLGGRQPKMSDGKLIVEGMVSFAADDAGARRAQVALAPLEAPPAPGTGAQDRKLSRGLSMLAMFPGLTRPGSAMSGPSLQEWQIAIAREVPELELALDEAEKELRKLRLYPIVCQYELRTLHNRAPRHCRVASMHHVAMSLQVHSTGRLWSAGAS
jgi:hypothetical protein